MNIVNTLTIRHLKQNKRRTLVTIIGVIISVAMVTAVATLVFSFSDLMIRQAIADTGEWHVQYQAVTKEQLAAIQGDDATKTVAISRDLGYAPLEGGQNPNKPYLFIKEYDAQGFAQFPVDLSKGRLPHTDKEVVISEPIATNAKVKYEIGDRLTLRVGERFEQGGDHPLDQTEPLRREDGTLTETLQHIKTRDYTVVGFIKRPVWETAWAPGYTIISYVDDNIIGANDRVDAAVVLQKVNPSLFANAEDLAKQNQIETVQYNNGLLRYYGLSKSEASYSMMFSLSAIIMGVIMIGSVSLIYNAFAISVSERSRHLGMLASVGATKRQKRNSVLFEGIVIGLISIPIGILCGIAGIGITFWFMNAMIEGALWTSEKLRLIVTPLSLLIACLVSMLTIFVSTYLPAIKASKVSAMDAIRQTTDVKLTAKAVKTSKFIRKFFGIEAEIGLKNLKRNKRRYHAIVFSLVISIVLFLTVSFFTAGMTQSLELSREGVNYDIEVSYSNGKRIDEGLMRSIVSLDGVTEYNVIHELYGNAWVDVAIIADELQEKVKKDKSMLQDGKYPYDIKIHALNDSSLQAYAKEVGADYEQLTDPDHPAAIVMDTIHYKDMGTGKYVQTKAMYTNVGQSIELTNFYKENGEETKANKVSVAALTDQAPMGMNPTGVGGLNMIVSERVMNRLADDEDLVNVSTYLHLKSTEPMRTQQEIEEMHETNLNVYNVYQSRKSEEQQILLMSVFSYGFIVLISAISIANIFNTISTGLSLRKREFAMLKSVGLTPKGFAKMMNYESIFYGVKSLLFGLPISFVVMYLTYRAFSNKFSYGFTLPWMSILSVIVAVFVIVSFAIVYSGAKVKKENIIDALKQENI
ncbi:ABC transporter permease [Brevibacillus laterosporus]|uniref:ABC-type transport system, permease n=1 Tax=Brevibacillus laterosporus LMG 15441 TaxID=1042163 RepID=A0A075RAP2_BRELA|nr:ABC transporter permease [Brevibacillus laterosporus]AIG26610.1 ABC-type transport system, permease [Brevibacillus laterosporus LMG 15441]RJL14139.1 ABC transporter permease [Brevibacillus laterosporus]